MLSSPQMGNTGGFLLIGFMVDKANTALLTPSCIFMDGKRFREQVKKSRKSFSKKTVLSFNLSRLLLSPQLLTFCPRFLEGLTALTFENQRCGINHVPDFTITFDSYKSVQVGRDPSWILYYILITIIFLFLLILKEIKI